MSGTVRGRPGWHRLARQVRRWSLPVLLGAALVGMARLSAPPAAPSSPELVIRPIDADLDAADLERIEALRQKLPGRNRRRHNFAWAQARIEGLEKTEYFAHSGIQRLGQYSAEIRKEIAGISERPRQFRFEVLCVNHNDEVDGPNCFFRNADTERKIIEDMAKRMPDPSVKGSVRLYTDLYPCASCRHVMTQFLGVYTNVHLLVLYRDR